MFSRCVVVALALYFMHGCIAQDNLIVNYSRCIANVSGGVDTYNFYYNDLATNAQINQTRFIDTIQQLYDQARSTLSATCQTAYPQTDLSYYANAVFRYCGGLETNLTQFAQPASFGSDQETCGWLTTFGLQLLALREHYESVYTNCNATVVFNGTFVRNYGRCNTVSPN